MLKQYCAALLFATLTLMPWLAHAEQRQMKCESWNFQPATCDTGLQTTNVTKYQQLSAADCTLGSTWSYDSRYIKVTNGCRAVFTATGTATGTETGTSTPTSTTESTTPTPITGSPTPTPSTGSTTPTPTTGSTTPDPTTDCPS
jgi:DUF3011 family protein